MTVRSSGPLELAPTVLAVCLVAGCAHRAAGPAPVPAAVPTAPTVAPQSASGIYDLSTTLGRTQPALRTGRSARPQPGASFQLAYQALAAPDVTAPSSTQFAATVNIPGYTRAPRGRPGQAACWWPLPGDSVVVHFQPPQQHAGTIDLRGMLKSDTLWGEIWYTSLQTGNASQMGTFVAVRRRK